MFVSDTFPSLSLLTFPPVGALGNTNVAGANASIAMILVFGIVYSFTYTPLQALYCAE